MEFADCQAEACFNIELPDSSQKDSEGNIPKNSEPVCFMLELSEADMTNVT